MKLRLIFLITLLTVTVLTPDLGVHIPGPLTRQTALARLQSMPQRFEINTGQADSSVRFISRSPGITLLLDDFGAEIRTEGTALRIRPANANPGPEITGLDPLPGAGNYLLDKDPRKWITGVRSFAKVRYESVWPGIDLIWHGDQNGLEYDFVVSPGAAPSKIGMICTGADDLRIDESGDLVITTPGGTLRQSRPFIYQMIDGRQKKVEGGYAIQERKIGFRIGEYDPSLPLIIDPILSYSALIDCEFITAVATDAAGAIYFTGLVRSHAFQISADAAQFVRGNSNASAAFVAKLNPQGNALEYSTYIGGFERFDYPYAITVDGQGSAYVVGFTGSNDLMVTPGAFQPKFAGPGQVGNLFGGDGFALKLNPTGSALVYSTYLGGAVGPDDAYDVKVDMAGNAYIAGTTSSVDFPVTPGAAITSIPAMTTAGFVTKLNPQGTGLVWSTYTPGVGRSIAVDSDGSSCITGQIFPNIFVAKVNSSGSGFDYLRKITGIGEGLAIALDRVGNAHVTGRAVSGITATGNAFQKTQAGASDAFLARLTTSGDLTYLSFLGGKLNDKGVDIAVDASGADYIIGETISTDFPLVNPFQTQFGNSGMSQNYRAAFVTKVNPAGSAIDYSSYYGDGIGDFLSIDLIGSGQAVIAGTGLALSSGVFFSTWPSALESPYGTYGGFITRIDESLSGLPDLTVSLGTAEKLYFGTNGVLVATVTNVGAVASNGPVRLQINFNDLPFLRNVTGNGWYSFGNPGTNPVVMVYTGSIAPGATAKLYIEQILPPSGEIGVTAKISNISDSNSGNNSTVATFTMEKGCFIGGSVRLPQVLPGAGGSYNHPVNFPCPGSWRAVSNAAWITVETGPVTGNGSFNYTVAPNTSKTARLGSITFEGISLEIDQDFIPGIANVSAATFGGSILYPQETVAVDSIVAMFGSDLSTSTVAATAQPLPYELAGTTVSIRDAFGVELPAPLFFVSPRQVNYLVPHGLGSGYGTVTVNSAGRAQTSRIRIAPITPGLFSANADGAGVPAAILVRVSAGGTQNYEPVAEFNQQTGRFIPRLIEFGPDPNEQLYLILFGTGIRNNSGQKNVRVHHSQGVADALYAGPQGDFAGLDQVNIQLNRMMVDYGRVYIYLNIEGQESNRLQIEFKR